MSGFELKVTGLDEFIKRMETAPDVIQKKGTEAIEDFCQGVEGDAKAAAPVDFGFLKNNITSEPVENLQGGVQSGADYSAYVEWGTGTKVSIEVDEDLRNYEAQFKGGKEIPGMYARPFFFPAVRKWKTILEKKLTDILKNL